MCEMEDRLNVTISENQNHELLQFKGLPSSSNTSGVSMDTQEFKPVNQSTPLEKDARKSFPSKIRPPNLLAETPMAKALKKSVLEVSEAAGDSSKI